MKRIQAVETNIQDMVSRHIKKNGIDDFEGSNLVVTKRISKEEIIQSRINSVKESKKKAKKEESKIKSSE